MFRKSPAKNVAVFNLKESQEIFATQIERLNILAELVEEYIPDNRLQTSLAKPVKELQTTFDQMYAAIANPTLDKFAIREFRGKFASENFNELTHAIIASFPNEKTKALATDITQKISDIRQGFFKHLHAVENSSKADSIKEFVKHQSDADVILTPSMRKM